MRLLGSVNSMEDEESFMDFRDLGKRNYNKTDEKWKWIGDFGVFVFINCVFFINNMVWIFYIKFIMG